MAIITMSHDLGSGGPEIGQALAERLAYRYVGAEVISEVAHRYGLAEDKLAHLDEAKPSLFERFDAETRRYLIVIQTALYEFAEGDNVILMGRGGQWLLRGVPHCLRARVMAPFELRVKRLSKKMTGQMGEQPNARTVTDMVRRDDGEKIGRMRYLYEVDVRDPSLYDIVINTEKTRIDSVVDALAIFTKRPELATTPEGIQTVRDRALASRVQVALASNPETRKYRTTVEAKEGVVTLEGTAALDEALAVARAVEGVRYVRAQQVEIPPMPPFVA